MRRLGGLLIAGAVGCGPKAPPVGPTGLVGATARPRVEAPTARSREQFLRAQVAFARGDAHAASHGLGRAAYEDPGSGAIAAAWAEAALRAGDLEQLGGARSALQAVDPGGALPLAAAALWAVGRGGAAQPAVAEALGAWPASGGPHGEAAGLLWRSLGPAAGAAAPALADRLAAEGLALDCLGEARAWRAAGATAEAVAALRGCAGALPPEALPEASRLLAGMEADPGAAPLALLLSDRLWVEHPAPPADVAARSVALAGALGDAGRAGCWSGLAARGLHAAEGGGPGYAPAAPREAAPVADVGGALADPALARWLAQRAARWARC